MLPIQAEREAAVQFRAGDEELARVVDALLDLSVLVVGAVVAETDRGERRGSGALEARMGIDPGCQRLRHADLLADHRGDPLAPVSAHDEPEFEGAEAAAERNPVI